MRNKGERVFEGISSRLRGELSEQKELRKVFAVDKEKVDLTRI